MPYYDYCCPFCHLVLEIQRGMNEEVEIICSECGGHMEQVIGRGVSVRCNWDDLPTNPKMSRGDLLK